MKSIVRACGNCRGWDTELQIISEVLLSQHLIKSLDHKLGLDLIAELKVLLSFLPLPASVINKPVGDLEDKQITEEELTYLKLRLVLLASMIFSPFVG